MRTSADIYAFALSVIVLVIIAIFFFQNWTQL